MSYLFLLYYMYIFSCLLCHMYSMSKLSSGVATLGFQGQSRLLIICIFCKAFAKYDTVLFLLFPHCILVSFHLFPHCIPLLKLSSHIRFLSFTQFAIVTCSWCLKSFLTLSPVHTGSGSCAPLGGINGR